MRGNGRFDGLKVFLVFQNKMQNMREEKEEQEAINEIHVAGIRHKKDSERQF